MKRPRAATAILGSLAIVSVLTGSWTAAAQTAAAPETHCAFRLEPLATQQALGEIAAQPVLIGCFPTVAESVSAGTGGAVILPAGLPGNAVTQEVLNQSALSAPATSFLIGQEFDSINYCCATAGQFVEYFASSGCSASTSWTVSYVGDAWNDRFESGKGFSGCGHNKKYQGSGFGQPLITCSPNCSTYLSLRNQVSSLKWNV